MRAAGFPDPKLLPGMHVSVVETPSGRHSAAWSCDKVTYQELRALESVSVQFHELAARSSCAKCDRSYGEGAGASALTWAVLRSCEVAADIRSAARAVAGTGTIRQAAALTKLADSLAKDRLYLTELCANPEFTVIRPTLDELGDRLDETSRALLDHRRGDAHRSVVAARIVAEMTPPKLRSQITLESTPTLVAITPGGSPARKVREVIHAFTVRTANGAPVLICPRYVVDYIHRHYQAGANSAWPVAVLSAAAGGYADAELHAAAQLLDPLGDGPMADPAAALAAAKLMS